MTMKSIGLLMAAAVLWGGVATVRAADERRGAPTAAANAALAEKLAGQVANIQQDDLVLISGSVADLRLLEDLAVAVRKRGAFPMMTLSSGTLMRRMVDEVPEQFDSQVPQFDMNLAGFVSAEIMVEIPDQDKAMAGISASRLAAYSKGFAAPYKRAMDRNVRIVTLGNGLYPTGSRAALFGMKEAELRKIYEDALNVDYPQMQATAARLKGILATGKQMHITAPGGTDLTLDITGQSPGTSDGVITPEKQKQGGAACQTWLPAGEVFVRTVADSAEGKAVFDHFYFEGKDCHNVVFTIKAGKITGITADTGLERLREVYDAAAPGKERLSAIDLGINPSIRLAPGSRLRNFIPAGMISVNFGDDSWAGGDVSSGFDLIGQLPGGTLTLDGQTLIENGELTVK
jgi:leucyl aminopeptidase (aminopeptidase T)